VRVVDLKKDTDLKEEVRRYFPHPTVRGYQADLANRLYEALTAMTIRITIVEAPTGLGKWADRKPIPADRGSWREF
jgi:superfamily II DNA or RNA helicase